MLSSCKLGFGHGFKHDAPKGGRKSDPVEKAADEAKTGRESWMHYDEWWESEGEKTFRAYVERTASKAGSEED